MRLHVATYNIHSCIGLDRAYSPQRIAEVLRELNCDLYALQEVDCSLTMNDGRDQLRYLEDEMQMTALHGPTLSRAYGSYGNALLTRHLIRDVHEIDLSYRKFEPRGAICVLLEVNHEPLYVVNTHLGLKFWERLFQVQRILDDLKDQPDVPIILLGDFNEWLPFSVNLFKLRKKLTAIGSSPATFPSLWPRLALDRIFVFPKPQSFHLWRILSPQTRIASDHLPLKAEIEWSIFANS